MKVTKIIPNTAIVLAALLSIFSDGLWIKERTNAMKELTKWNLAFAGLW